MRKGYRGVASVPAAPAYSPKSEAHPSAACFPAPSVFTGMSDPDRTLRAAEWLLALDLCQQSDGLELHGALRVWLSDPKNAAQFSALVSLRDDLKPPGVPPCMPSEGECASDTYDCSMSVADWLVQRTQEMTPKG